MVQKYWMRFVRLGLLALVAILLVSCSISSCGCSYPNKPYIYGLYLPGFSGSAEAEILDAKGSTSSAEPLYDNMYQITLGHLQAPYLVEVRMDAGGVFYTTDLTYLGNQGTNKRSDVSRLTTLALVLASYEHIPEFNNLASLRLYWPLLAPKLNADSIDHASKVIYANLQAYYIEEGLLPDGYNAFFYTEYDQEYNGISQVISRTRISYDFSQTMPAGITIKVDGNVIPFDPYINVDAIDFTYQCTLERQERGECNP